MKQDRMKNNKGSKTVKDNGRAVTYTEIARAQISKTKAFVLSEFSKGGYTLAQQMSVMDETTGKPMTVYLKGALRIVNINTLEKVRDMLTVAIERYKEDHDSVDWDEREAAAENNC